MLRAPIVAALAAELVALAGAFALVADFRAHRASEQLGGVNIWGYRGPVMLQKVPDEIRIAVVGGELAFGWGVAASETLAPSLRFRAAIVLDAPGRHAHRVSAVNLGARGLAAAGYAERLQRYRYLKPDIVCVFVDPPGVAAGRSILPRADSAIFAATGYVPMLPLVLVDKGTATGWRAMAAAGRLMGGIDGAAYDVFAGWRRPPESTADPIEQTIRAALEIAGRVIVIAPPYSWRGGDVPMHAALAAMVARAFAADPRVRLVDLGDIPELADPSLRLDEVNFSAAGHSMIAEHVVPTLLELVH